MKKHCVPAYLARLQVFLGRLVPHCTDRDRVQGTAFSYWRNYGEIPGFKTSRNVTGPVR